MSTYLEVLSSRRQNGSFNFSSRLCCVVLFGSCVIREGSVQWYMSIAPPAVLEYKLRLYTIYTSIVKSDWVFG